MVQYVEHIHSRLQVSLLREMEHLGQRHVPGAESGRDEGIPSKDCFSAGDAAVALVGHRSYQLVVCRNISWRSGGVLSYSSLSAGKHSRTRYSVQKLLGPRGSGGSFFAASSIFRARIRAVICYID